MAFIGIDEAGRGSWAGPLCVSAVRFEKLSKERSYFDSKSLTRASRKLLFHRLQSECQIGLGWVSAASIDRMGLSTALRIAADTALMQLPIAPDDTVIIDGPINFSSYASAQPEVSADATFEYVSAASIAAKVCRDRYMQWLSTVSCEYGFEKHVGYGTAFHRQMLLLHGVSSHHRKSFKPILRMANS